MSRQKKLTIGLTGGIGSGKSTVANEFKKMGITIIDTDEIARKVVRQKSSALKQIRQKLGNEIINSDGSLNRSALRDIIFSKPPLKKWLEKLLHPLIAKQMLVEIKKATSPYVVAVIPLLFETNFHQYIDRVLVVDASLAERKKRVVSRDGISSKLFNAIATSQISRNERLKKANDVIRNNKSKIELRQLVTQLHNFYLTI